MVVKSAMVVIAAIALIFVAVCFFMCRKGGSKNASQLVREVRFHGSNACVARFPLTLRFARCTLQLEQEEE